MRKVYCRQIILVLIALLLTPAMALAKDPFKQVVKYFESNHKAHRQRIPLLGFANLVLWVARPAGVKNVKVAKFDRHHFVPQSGNASLRRALQKAMSKEWRPMVEIESRNGVEHTYIYGRPSGKYFKFFVVNIDATEAHVVQVEFNPEKLRQRLNDGNDNDQDLFTAINLGRPIRGMQAKGSKDTTVPEKTLPPSAPSSTNK